MAHSFGKGGVVSKGPKGKSATMPSTDPNFKPNNPSQPQYPPGSPEHRRAGSPRMSLPSGVAGPELAVPTNTDLSGSRVNPIAQPAAVAAGVKEQYTPTKIASGNNVDTYLNVSNMGNTGEPVDLRTDLPPVSEWDKPENKAMMDEEFRKTNQLTNEPAVVKSAAMDQITSGSPSMVLEGEDELLKKSQNLAPEESR